MPDPDSVPKGFVFFTRPASPRQQRRRRWFVACLLLAALALTWPGYVPFAGIFPLVLGLPLSLAWVVFWLFVILAAQVWLYRGDCV